MVKKPKNLGNIKEIKIPKKDEKLAEFIGIILGDGNITNYKGYKKNKYIARYDVRIAGNAEDDYEYLVDYVWGLAEHLFNIEPKIYRHNSYKCIYIRLQGIRVVEFLSKTGLKSGNKIKNQTTIPMWVWKKDSYLKACIRGLIDTDGSVYELLPNWPGLFQIIFTNQNLTLLNDVRNALIKLDYKVSKISNLNKNNSRPRIYITKKDEVIKFYNDVGFKNPKHSRKLEKYFNSPVV